MSPSYSLLVHSAKEIQWKPGSRATRAPNLYVTVSLAGVGVFRTLVVRGLSPTWRDQTTLSTDDPAAPISVEVFHRTSIPFRRDLCIGRLKISLDALLELCLGDSGSQVSGARGVIPLELIGVSGSLKGKKTGTVYLHIRNVAANASDGAQTIANDSNNDIEPRRPAGTETLDMLSAFVVITSRLNVLVKVWDNATEATEIHPYAKLAWTILTSVYMVVNKQQETHDGILKILWAMVELYSFVKEDFGVQNNNNRTRLIVDILKQTVECAMFIREYTGHGFSGRRYTSSDATKIDDLCDALRNLKSSFDLGLAVQPRFISANLLDGAESDVQGEKLEYLHPVPQNTLLFQECFPGTRKDILTHIIEWCTMASDGGNILWLNGMAGAGKTAISTTVAEYFRGLDRLGGVVFFDRSDQARSIPSAVLRTIAYQLAVSNPHLRAAISDVISGDRTLIAAPIQTQFRKMIWEPLVAVQKHIYGPIVIILDGLDECGDRSSRESLISLITEDFPKFPAGFRVFITSRPEADIAARFQKQPLITKIQLDIETESTKQDIISYISQMMQNMTHKHPALGPEWPKTADIQRLADASGGLFIWASMACKFVDGYDPKERLASLLAPSNTSNLDALYLSALHSAPWDNQTFSRDAVAILGAIILSKMPITDKTIDGLLGFKDGVSSQVLQYLGNVLQWTPGKPIHILHTSFSDYLTDATRSGDKPWCIDLKSHNKTLTLRCFHILRAELRFNICDLRNSNILNADVPDLLECITSQISPHLSYASQFWAHHLQDTLDHEMLPELQQFFRDQQFLYWLEVLSLLKHMECATESLRIVLNYAQKRAQNLVDLIQDSVKFLEVFAPLIAESVPHIYISAIPFSPQQSLIHRKFGSYVPWTLTVDEISGEHLSPMPKIFRGGSMGVTSVAFSPDGRYIVSGSWDSTIRVWNFRTAAVVRTLTGHSLCVTTVEFSPDGTRIVSGSRDKTVCIWDTQSGIMLAGPFYGHTDDVTSAAFSPDGIRIVSGSHDHTLRVWDSQTGAMVSGPFLGHTDWVRSVAFSPEGMQIVSGSDDMTVRVWDSETAALIAGPFQGHLACITSVAFSPDGLRIVSGSHDQIVRVWDSQTGVAVTGPFKGHIGGINSVGFSPDGSQIVSGSWDCTVRVWDSNDAMISQSFTGHTGDITSVRFSPDGTQIASGSDDGTVRVWDSHPDKFALPVGTFGAHTDYVASVAFSPDGLRIVSGSQDQTVRVWDSKTGIMLNEPFKGHTDGITSVGFSPDGLQIVSGSKDRTVRVWDSRTGILIAGMFKGHTKSVTSVTFSPDGRTIVSGSQDRTVCVWDSRTGVKVAGPFEGHTSGVSSVAFSPDGSTVVSGSQDHTVRVWDFRTGAMVAGPFEGHTNGVTSVAFSPDGFTIVSGSQDQTVRVWDSRTGVMVTGPFEGHSDWVRSVTFSRDGMQVVSGSDDQTIRIWDSRTAALIAGPFIGHTGYVSSAMFSPDGKQIVTGSFDSTIRVWEVQNADPWGSHPFFTAKGWMMNSSLDHIVWVPPWLRNNLQLPWNSLVIAAGQTTKLNLNHFVCGTNWLKCISPLEHSL